MGRQVLHSSRSGDQSSECFDKLALAEDACCFVKHGAVIVASLTILRGCFTNDGKIEGYRKDGPVAKFELGEGDEPEQREAQALRQRQVSDVVEQVLARIG